MVVTEAPKLGISGNIATSGFWDVDQTSPVKRSRGSKERRLPQPVLEVPDAVLRAFLGSNANLAKVRKQGLGRYSLDEIRLVHTEEGAFNRLSLMDNQRVYDWGNAQRGTGIENEKIYAVRGILRFAEKRAPEDKGNSAYIDVAPTSPTSPRAIIWIGNLDDATRYRIEDRPESYQIAAAVQIDNNSVGKTYDGIDVYYGSVFPKAVFHVSNPDHQTQRRLDDGAIVVLDGLVTHLSPSDKHPMEVLLDNGKTRRIDIGSQIPLVDTDKFDYAPGPDEAIQLHNEVIIETEKQGRRLINRTGLATVTLPNWIQDREYQYRRELIGQALDGLELQISNANYETARDTFARLRQSVLTFDEQGKVRELIAKFPDDERPFISSMSDDNPRRPRTHLEVFHGYLGTSPEFFTPHALLNRLKTLLGESDTPPEFNHVATLIQAHPEQFGEHVLEGIIHEVVRARTTQLGNENPNAAIHVLNDVLPQLEIIGGRDSVDEIIGVVSASIILGRRIRDEEHVQWARDNWERTTGNLPVVRADSVIREDTPIIPKYAVTELIYNQSGLRELIDTSMHVLKNLLLTDVDGPIMNPHMMRLLETESSFNDWASYLGRPEQLTARGDWRAIRHEMSAVRSV